MKEHSIAFSVSLLFHIVIVALLLRVPFDKYIKPKIMTLDFFLEQGRVIDDVEDRNHESGIINRESRIEDQKSQKEMQMTDYRNRTIEQEHNVQNNSVSEPLSMKQSGLGAVASDPTGRIMVRGETGQMGVRADSVSEKNISVGESSRNPPAASGSMGVIDYSKDGSGARDFPFIADTINKRFKDKYPDRARRMEWEGEVLLSFIISEDGTIHDVKIVKGSGRSIFDDHAREILKKITFNRRLPYPIPIDNWRITYRLQ